MQISSSSLHLFNGDDYIIFVDQIYPPELYRFYFEVGKICISVFWRQIDTVLPCLLTIFALCWFVAIQRSC